MGEGLKRAFKAAKATRICPVRYCRRVKAPGGELCRLHQLKWDHAVKALNKP